MCKYFLSAPKNSPSAESGHSIFDSSGMQNLEELSRFYHFKFTSSAVNGCSIQQSAKNLRFTALHRQLAPPVLDHIGLFLNG